MFMASYINLDQSEANFSSFLKQAEKQLVSCDKYKRIWEVECKRWKVAHPTKDQKEKYKKEADKVIKNLAAWKIQSEKMHKELKQIIHIKPETESNSKLWENLSKLEPQFLTLCEQLNLRFPLARTACQSLHDVDSGIITRIFNYALGRTPDISDEIADLEALEIKDDSDEDSDVKPSNETDSKSNRLSKTSGAARSRDRKQKAGSI
jgi:hypothetical protein